jgi:hypothetical protein
MGFQMRLSDLGYTPVSVEVPSGLRVVFRYISGRDEIVLGRLLGSKLEARAFTIAFLHNQLVNEDGELPDLAAWTDPDLRVAARTFSGAEPSGFNMPITTSDNVYVEFQANAQAYYDELFRAVHESIRNLGESISQNMIPTLLLQSTGVFDLSGIGRNQLDASQYSLPQLGLERLTAALADQSLYRKELIEGSDLARHLNEVREQNLGNLRRVDDSLKLALDQLVAKPQFDPSVSAFTTLTGHFRTLSTARQGIEALEAAGFGYSVELWELDFLAEIAAQPASGRSQFIAGEMRTFVDSDDLEGAIEEYFSSTSIVAKRRPMVLEGIQNHREDRFYSSICVLLPQAEGIITDMLVHTGTAEVRTSKVFRLPDNKSDGYELKGLQNKGEEVRKVTSIDKALAEHITESVVPFRNGALHGTDVDFGTREQSEHVILVLLSLAVVASQFDPTNHVTGNW